MSTIQQLSVFLENREGRLDEVLDALGSNGSEYCGAQSCGHHGVRDARMIVSDPERGREELKKIGIMAMLTPVIALRVPHDTGSLSKAMHQLVQGGINVEYMYAFANGEDASAVLKTNEPQRAAHILNESGFGVWEADEAYRANR